ncbi:MAG: HIT family protein [Bacteroidetes bacterium]|nr:HIT family protein [Bacteroidota bacterium]
MKSIFSKIIDKEISAHIIEEDQNNIAFLDINPISKGHTLVIPKKQIDNIFDLPEADYINLYLFAKKIAIAIKKVISCQRIGEAVVGLEVPHAHIHLIPINKVEDINFQKEKLKINYEEMRDIANNIKLALRLLKSF